MSAYRRALLAACAVAFVVLVLAGVNSATRAEEETIAASDLPTAVTDKIKELYPDAEIVEAEKETEDGKTVYEVELKTGGKTLEVEFDSSGAVLEEEEETDDDD